MKPSVTANLASPLSATDRPFEERQVEFNRLQVGWPGSPLRVDFGREVHCLLGLPFDDLSLDAAALHVKRCALQARPCFFSTVNVNFVIAAAANPAFRDSVMHSDLSLIDGMPLVWLAGWLGLPMKERVAGADLFERLNDMPGPAVPVCFFGGPDGAASQALAALNARRGGLVGVGAESPGFVPLDAMSTPDVLARINQSGARFLVVALGAVKGQAWIERNRGGLNVPVISHLGAVVNFAAGSVKRAPAWMRWTGLEWLWRIREEPALWRRYASDGMSLLGLVVTRILPLLWRRWFGASAPPADGRIRMRASVKRVEMALPGAWHGDRTMATLREALAATADEPLELELRLDETRWLDSQAIALLQLLVGFRSAAGLSTRFTGAAPALRRTLRLWGADELVSGHGPAAAAVPGGTSP